MSNLSFLSENQVVGENRLELFKKFGSSTNMSGFSILLGGLDGYWWTKTPKNSNNAFIVDKYGNIKFENINSRQIGVRPILPYSEIEQFCSNVSLGIAGVKEVEYGEYPQTVVSEELSNTLDSLYLSGNLKFTGRSYTTDYANNNEIDSKFKLSCHPECSDGNKKYIRFLADSRAHGKKLPDGRIIRAGNIYWITVEPITWLIDENADIAITKDIIVAGLQFSNEKNYYGDFEKTDIKRNLDSFFSGDIITSKIYYEKQKAFLKEFGELKDLIAINYFDLATKGHKR